MISSLGQKYMGIRAGGIVPGSLKGNEGHDIPVDNFPARSMYDHVLTYLRVIP